MSWLAWLLKGRRAVLAYGAPDLCERYAAQRSGSCRRCGACCALATPCPFAGRDASGLATCAVYQWRPESCRVFPASAIDLRELPPGTRCGYAFARR